MEEDKSFLNEQVGKARELMLEMERETEKYKKLSVLTKMNLVDVIKNLHGSRFFKYVTLLEQAVWYVNKQKEEYKEAYDLLCETIKEDFCNREFEIKEISMCGYERYGYNVNFTVGSRWFSIFVPDVKQMSVENFEYLSEGKLNVSEKTSSYVWKAFASSYFADDIKEALEKRLTEGK